MLKQILASIGVAVLIGLAPVLVLAQADKPDYGDTDNTGLICPKGDNLASCIPRLYNFALAISGFIAMGILVAAGYLYMTAGGDGQQLGTAKEMVGAVAAGIVILATAYILLAFLNPDLVKLNNPSLNIESQEYATGGGTSGDQGSGGSSTPDTEPPVIELVNIIGVKSTDTAYAPGVIKFTVNINEQNLADYGLCESLNSRCISLTVQKNVSNSEVLWDTSREAPRTRVVKAWARDRAGNMGFSQPVTIDFVAR